MKTCTIDTAEIERLFDNLDEDNRKQALATALKAGAKTLQEQTVETLLVKMPTANEKMKKGVKTKFDKDYEEAIIHIMGYYLLWIFENGTVERRTIKRTNGARLKKGERAKAQAAGAYRGKIEPKHFFESARSNEQPIVNSIFQTLDREITKLTK